jgi:cysteine-rich repeat protein
MTLPLSALDTSAGIRGLELLSHSSTDGDEVLLSTVDADGMPLDEPAAVMRVDDVVTLLGELQHFSTLKISTACGLVFVFESNIQPSQPVAQTWQATVAVRNENTEPALVSQVKSIGLPCDTVAVVAHGNPCGDRPSTCCEKLVDTLINPNGGDLPPGGSVVLSPPVEYRCTRQGAGRASINVLTRVAERGDGSSHPYYFNQGASTTCVGQLCGNQMIDPGEQCDGAPPTSTTCSSLGFDGGTLSCTPSCTIDTTPCYQCGDGMREGAETCDGADLGGMTCAGLGFGGGTLACDVLQCTFDTTGCNACGNGTIDGTEQCDGANLNGKTCSTIGSYDAGTLSCTSGCALDDSMCTRCGDAVMEGTESCDGSDLGGKTCASIGFMTGTLACSSQCTLDISRCSTCGDGTIEFGEECEGTNLNGRTCTSLGYFAGTLACNAQTCRYNPSSCTNCGNGMVEIPEVCDGTAISPSDTCLVHGFDDGSPRCSPACTLDLTPCTDCGDGQIESPEECEPGNLNGETCVSRGFGGGTLTCNAGCRFNTAGCTTPVCGNGVVEGGETCDDSNQNSGDGCGFNCRTDPGYTCTGQPSTCILTCGNGVLDAGEGCEDGFREAFDGCSTGCVPEPGFTCVGAGQGSCTTPCGDSVPRGFEFCDDGNSIPGDVCNNACQLNGAILETEPNDDGTPGEMVSDFSAANANGPIDVAGATDTIYAAKLYRVSGAAGDDDTFAVRNTGVNAKIIRVDTYAPETGVGNPCTGFATDTRIFVRNSAGSVQAQNNDRSGQDRCSGLFVSVPAATTFYVHVQHTTDSNNVAAYFLRVQSAACGNGGVGIGEECEPPGTGTCDTACQRVPVCGDGNVDGTEQCDDGDLVSGDGCSSSCTWELVAEQEPNDDGATAPMSNDFSSVNANGPTTATRMYSASIGPVGDDDVYSIANPSLAPISVRIDTWVPAFGAGAPCGFTIDTRIVVRDAAGTSLQSSDDRGGLSDKCSGVDVVLAPGETKYVHVTDAADFSTLSYWLQMVFP